MLKKWMRILWLQTNKNAAEFIEIVKDKICDWISYHNVYVPKHMSLEDVNKFGVFFNEASKMFKDFRKGGH